MSYGALDARGNQPGLIIQPRPPSGTWKIVADFDFENVPLVTDLSAAGSYDVEGVRLWAKGSLWPLSGGFSDTQPGPGGGIRLGIAAAVGADRPIWRLTGSFPGRVIFFPFAQFSSWKPAIPTWVVWRLVSPLPMSFSANRTPVAGIGGMASSSSAITSAEKARAPCWAQFGSASNQFYMKGTDALGAVLDASLTSTEQADYQWGILRGMPGAYSWGVDAYTTSLDAPNQNFTVNFADLNGARPFYVQFSEPAGTVEAPNMGFFFSMHKPFTDANPYDLRLNKLAIMQPG